MPVFDYGGIYEVFDVNRMSDGVPRFNLWRCGSGRRAVTLIGEPALRLTHGLAALPEVDLIVVHGSNPAPARATETELPAPRTAHAAGVPIATLCSGAFVLADAGLSMVDEPRPITSLSHRDFVSFVAMCTPSVWYWRM